MPYMVIHYSSNTTGPYTTVITSGAKIRSKSWQEMLIIKGLNQVIDRATSSCIYAQAALKIWLINVFQNKFVHATLVCHMSQ